MPEEKLSEFRALVFADDALQKSLREIETSEDFVRAVVEAGSERGFEFTAEEIEAAMRVNRRAWIERWLG